MEKEILIGKLGMIKGGDWDDPIGKNSVQDFVKISDLIIRDEEIMAAIRRAVGNRIAYKLAAEMNALDAETLYIEKSPRHTIWEQWCNEKIDIDFSDIQKLLEEE